METHTIDGVLARQILSLSSEVVSLIAMLILLCLFVRYDTWYRFELRELPIGWYLDLSRMLPFSCPTFRMETQKPQIDMIRARETALDSKPVSIF